VPAPRPLLAVPCPPGEAGVWALLPGLEAALTGNGPALLPLPPGAEGDRIASVMRPDLPVEAGTAVVVATSGSSGEPKGVLLSAAALRASALATAERLGGPAQWLLALPVVRVAGLQVLVRSLLARTSPVVLDTADGFDVGAFVEATGQLDGPRRCTALVPTQLLRLLDAGGEALVALASYDAVLLGGAAAPAPLLARARDAGVAVVTTYGMTETCGGCVYDGLPLSGVQVDTVEGRVRVRGPVLADGYRLRPDLTEAAFAGGSFDTGDLGHLDLEGRLVVTGRADDVIISGGENVAPGPVEDVLAGFPAVAEVAVVGRPDAEWGQRVTAVVVPRDPAVPPRLDDLRDAVIAAGLPRAAAPRALEVVDVLPLLPSGKIDRRSLGRGRPLEGR
jgi:o-succinylbenzoate---CoA ligase